MNAEHTYLEKEKHRTKPPILVFKMLIIADVYTFQKDIKVVPGMWALESTHFRTVGGLLVQDYLTIVNIYMAQPAQPRV